MNKEIPVANRVIHERVTHKNNCILTDKIIRMKFANFSALQGQSEPATRKRSTKMDKTNLKSVEGRQVRSVMEHERIHAQNKMILKRLVKQKSTLSNKIFAQQRHRNIQFLKRIGRYPYKNMELNQLEPLFTQESENQGRFHRRHTLGDFDQDDSNSQINVVLSNNSQQATHHSNHNIVQMLTEESKKQHIIILWTKAIQLGKSWYNIQYSRLKDHYQIELVAYLMPKIQYLLRLGQKEGTSLLTEFDYDYAHISSQCLKISQPNINLSFELKIPKKKRYFYRFQKNDVPLNSQREERNYEVQKTQAYARKTMFAIENEFNQRKQRKIDRIKRNTNEVIIQQSYNILNIHSSDICLQQRRQ